MSISSEFRGSEYVLIKRGGGRRRKRERERGEGGGG